MSAHYYISGSHAQVKLAERAPLRLMVEDYWESNQVLFPKNLFAMDRAILLRQVSTFRFEDGLFVLLAESAGLKPTWLSYVQDKFVTNSKMKRSLVKPAVTSSVDKHGSPIKQVRKLIRSFDEWQGQKLGDIRTETGELIVDWHRQRLVQAVPEADVIDMSDMCIAWGGRAMDYYVGLLSLFVAHAVLFEDYHAGESGKTLDGFTATVFEPAVERVKELFGVGPLIVPLPWWPDLALHPEGNWLQDWRSCAVLQPTSG